MAASVILASSVPWSTPAPNLVMPLPGRDDLCRGRAYTCWNNKPFTAHLDQDTARQDALVSHSNPPPKIETLLAECWAGWREHLSQAGRTAITAIVDALMPE